MNRRALSLLGATAVVGGLSGCVAHSAQPVYYPQETYPAEPQVQAEIYVNQAPPAPIAEYPPPAP
ncbi:MAG TPA: hypothetical protein VGF45_13855, partial [Polyangia bacterium]